MATDGAQCQYRTAQKPGPKKANFLFTVFHLFHPFLQYLLSTKCSEKQPPATCHDAVTVTCPHHSKVC